MKSKLTTNAQNILPLNQCTHALFRLWTSRSFKCVWGVANRLTDVKYALVGRLFIFK